MYVVHIVCFACALSVYVVSVLYVLQFECVMLSYVAQCCTTLCCVLLYCTVLCCVALWRTVSFYGVLCYVACVECIVCCLLIFVVC